MNGIVKLSAEEMANPEQVFTSFFESFHLDDAKQELKQALDLIIEKKFKHREYSIEEDNTRFFYLKMEKLVEAAWRMRN